MAAALLLLALAASAESFELPADPFGTYSLAVDEPQADGRRLVITERRSARCESGYTARLIDCAEGRGLVLDGACGPLAPIELRARREMAKIPPLPKLTPHGGDAITHQIAARVCAAAAD